MLDVAGSLSHTGTIVNVNNSVRDMHAGMTDCHRTHKNVREYRIPESRSFIFDDSTPQDALVSTKSQNFEVLV